jgi:hypothetical protein
MSFAHFILEEGVEMEMQSEIGDVIVALDTDVPVFSYEDYEFHVRPKGGVVGSNWKLDVKAVEHRRGEQPWTSVGFIEVNKMSEGGTLLRIPPWNEWCESHSKLFAKEGDLFASFIFQLLNAFQARGLINLPAQLPIS